MDTYKLDKDLLERLLDVLGNNWFTTVDEEDFNNEDIISIHEEIEKEMKRQDEHLQ